MEALLHPWFLELNPAHADEETKQRIDALDAARYWAVATAPDNEVIGVAGLGGLWLDESLTAGLERPAEIFAVYVARPWLGLGIGRVLCADVEARARALGFTDLLAVSGIRHKDIGYPFWNRRYGDAMRVDPDYWAEGAERIVWRLKL